MKIIQPLLPAFFIIAFLQSNAQYVWRHRACLPATPRVDQASFTLGNKGFSVGGSTIDGEQLDEVWEYDPLTDTWTQKNNFPVSRAGATAFVINDTAYAGLGYDNFGDFNNDFYRYDQVADQWIQLSNFPGDPRYEPMSFVINGMGYTGCGFNGSEYDDFYQYNPATDTWTQMADFAGGPCQSGVGATVGNLGYIGLGYGYSGNISSFYSYDPGSNTWTALASLPAAGKDDPGYFVLNDTLYAGAGQDYRVTDYSDWWQYDVSTNTWIQEPGFGCIASGRATFRGFTLNGEGYIMFGCTSSYTEYFNDLLEFGPVDTAFTQQVNVLGNDTAYCGNFSLPLSVTDVCALWSTGAVGPQITINSAGTYWVRFNDSCGVSSDTLKVAEGDTITITGNEATICANDSAEFCAPGGFQSYLWNNGATTACIYTNLAGAYYVSATSPGCSGSSNRLNLNVLPVPPVEISISGDTLTCYDGIRIQWYYNGDSIIGDTGSVLIATQPGLYSVFIVDSNGCNAMSNQVLVSGINDVPDMSMKVYPNPLENGNWIIQSGDNIIGATAEIFDANGRLVYSHEITSSKWPVDFNAASGVYTLRILSANKYLIQKLVKL